MANKTYTSAKKTGTKQDFKGEKMLNIKAAA